MSFVILKLPKTGQWGKNEISLAEYKIWIYCTKWKKKLIENVFEKKVSWGWTWINNSSDNWSCNSKQKNSFFCKKVNFFRGLFLQLFKISFRFDSVTVLENVVKPFLNVNLQNNNFQGYMWPSFTRSQNRKAPS